MNILFKFEIGYVLFWTFIAWHYALRCGFVSDDHAVVAGRKDIIPDSEKAPKKEDYWIKVFNDGVVMYYLNRFMFKIGGRRLPLLWHTLSLALHLTNVFLVWKVLTPIYGNDIAVIASFLWAINPMLNQNVVWVSGRPYSIALCLALVGMLYWQHPIVFIPLYLLAVVTNISIALVPILMKMLHPGWQTTLYLIVMTGGAGAFIFWKFRKRFTGALVIDRENFRFKKRRVNAVVKVYAYYIWSFFVPINMGWYHQCGFRYNTAWDKFNIWTLVSYGVVGWLTTQGFAGWLILLGILPNANLFATNSFLQDRYLYFGSIGIAIICAPYLLQYPELLYVACTFYMARAYMYSRQLLNDETLYRENWRNHPRSDYAVNNLAFFLIQQKRYDEARVIILRGINIDRNNKMLWYNLGVTWAATGNLTSDEGKFRFLRAVDCWKMALQIEPRWAKPAKDLKTMIKFLVDNKVLTISKDEAAPGMPTIDIPAIGGTNGK